MQSIAVQKSAGRYYVSFEMLSASIATKYPSAVIFSREQAPLSQQQSHNLTLLNRILKKCL